MALARWQATIVDDAGNIQDGASVTVRHETSGSPLANIYSDREGETSIDNPFLADSEGFAAFHVAGGAYRITATKDGFSRVLRYVGIGLLSEQDEAVAVGALQAENNLSDVDDAPTAFGNIKQTAAEGATGVLDQATDTEIRAATSGAHAICAEDLQTAAVPVALTDAATVAIDWTAGINFTLTVTANRTLGNPTLEIPGQTRTVLVQGNDGTDRTLSFGSEYGGEVPTLDDIDSTKKYLLTIYCKSAGQFLVTAIDGTDA